MMSNFSYQKLQLQSTLHNSDHMGLGDFVWITDNPDYIKTLFRDTTYLLITPVKCLLLFGVTPRVVGHIEW